MSVHLGECVTKALIGIHIISGCDSVSAFHGKGKRVCFTTGLEEPFNTELAKLGSEGFLLEPTATPTFEKYICSIYICKTDNINEGRFQIFCSSAPEERSLPPTKDCLLQHLRRAKYQARIWKLATTAIMNCPSPVGHGWQMVDGKLQVLWMEGDVASPDILKLSYCRCKKTLCGSGRCSCVTAGLRCSDICQCSEGCKNRESVDNHNDHPAASDSEDKI